MKSIFRFSFIASLALMYSCRQIPNDGIPFYLKIDSALVLTNPSVEGDPTHAISDVWVEANATNLGAYELPVNFPVLLENEVRFIINPGIQESGQSNVRVVYPFLQPDTLTLNAVRGNFYTHRPSFRYRPAAIFSVVEDFESGNSFNGIQRITTATDTGIAYGLSCGKISVTSLDSNEIGALIQSKSISGGKEAWVEVDYKAEVPFYIGFYANYTGSVPIRAPIVFVTPKEKWSKLYVNLTNSIGFANANSYTLYFEALRPFGTNGGSLFLDNIKLIHY